jgi:hypothetical protein
MVATVPDTARQMREKRGAPAAETTPQASSMDPEDIAPFVCYLAGDGAANVNGQTFLVYGGIVTLLSQPRRVRTIFKQGAWDLDELSSLVPTQLTQGLVNPSPPQESRQ